MPAKKVMEEPELGLEFVWEVSLQSVPEDGIQDPKSIFAVS